MINNRQNGRRRGRGGGQGGPPRPNGSSGNQDRGNRIDNRARGNAAQLHEKYKALARDSQMQGDRVNTEYYLQFADHYFRVLSESRSRFEEQQPRPRRDDFTQQSDEDYGDEGERMGNQEQRSQPEPIFASRETDIQRDFGDRPVVDGNRSDRDDEDRRPRDEDRRPRRAARPPRTEQDMAPASYQAAPAEEAAAPTPAPSEEPAVQPRRRGRPPKVQPSEQIEVDRLPPSFSLQAPVDDGEAKPRPRTRRPRGETAAV